MPLTGAGREPEGHAWCDATSGAGCFAEHGCVSHPCLGMLQCVGWLQSGGMKPEQCSVSSSVRTATVLLFWACVSGCQVWDEMPGFAGKDSSGVAAFPWGFWVTLASGLAKNSSPSAEPAVR